MCMLPKTKTPGLQSPGSMLPSGGWHGCPGPMHMGSLARVKGGRPSGAAPTTARTTKGAAPLTLPCKNTSQTATFAQMVLKLPSCRDVGRDCPFQDIIRLHSLAGRNLSVSQPVSRLCLSAVRLTARQGLAASSPQVNFILYFVFIFF